MIVHEPVVQEVINSIIKIAIPAQEFNLPILDSEPVVDTVDTVDTVDASAIVEELSADQYVDKFIKLEPDVFPVPEGVVKPDVSEHEVTAQAEKSPISDTYIEEMIASDDEDTIVLVAPKSSTIEMVD